MMGRSVTIPVTLPGQNHVKQSEGKESKELTVNSHTDDEEWNENVDDIQTHQSVFRTREATTHVCL